MNPTHVLTLLLVVVLFPLAPSEATLRVPLRIELVLQAEPVVGEEVAVICSLYSDIDIPGVAAEVTLPQDIEHLSGDLSWQGDLKAGVARSFSARIVFQRSRNVSIRAVARSQLVDGIS